MRFLLALLLSSAVPAAVSAKYEKILEKKTITPSGKPIAPTGKPIDPTGKPFSPTGKPNAPTGQSVNPTGKPITPTGKPITPTGKPISPTEKPNAPTGQPITPTEKPISPTGKPNAPTGQPINPTGTPITPTGKPITPTGQPVSSNGKPISSTGKPNTPTGKPINPIVNPISLSGKPFTPTGKPNAPTGQPINPIVNPFFLSGKPVAPTGKPIAPVVTPVKAPSAPLALPICQYGGYCLADSDCYPGNYCNSAQMPYYSQCLPKPATYKTSKCLLNFYGNNQPCYSNNDCCDPGAYCNSNTNFRQCQQPVIGSVLCSNPSGFAHSKTSQPATQPVAKPSCQPVLPICQYGGYCKKNSDCHPGNYCRLDQLPYYSQCVPNPSSYKSGNCLANYSGNNRPCTSTSDCCDPGAYCNNYSFRQCQQPAIGSPVCSYPSGFINNEGCPSSATPTAKPTNTPSKSPSRSPTDSPTDTPSDAPTDFPAIVPTSSSQVILAFKQILSLQGVNCTTLSNCLPCQSAIAQTVFQILNLQPPDATVYISCSVITRRRLESESRSLFAVDEKTNATVGVTLHTNDPKAALDNSDVVIRNSIKTIELTTTLNRISSTTPGAGAVHRHAARGHSRCPSASG